MGGKSRQGPPIPPRPLNSLALSTPLLFTAYYVLCCLQLTTYFAVYSLLRPTSYVLRPTSYVLPSPLPPWGGEVLPFLSVYLPLTQHTAHPLRPSPCLASRAAAAEAELVVGSAYYNRFRSSCGGARCGGATSPGEEGGPIYTTLLVSKYFFFLQNDYILNLFLRPFHLFTPSSFLRRLFVA